MESVRPNILVVDDHTEDVRYLEKALGDQVSLAVVHPSEVQQGLLEAADLVLIDFRLDDWPSRDNVDQLSLKPMNGLALAAVLRSLSSKSTGASRADGPMAIALHSAHLADLSNGLPPETREHVIARSNNIEWAFEKNQNAVQTLVMQLVELASAIKILPSKWNIDQADLTQSEVKRMLDLSDEPWCDRAWSDVEDCHPPIHELSQASHGLAFIRWMLHRILPYPCFLRNSLYVAARLRIDAKDFERIVQERKIDSELDKYRYTGLLSEFSGARWWRSGVEEYLWNLTGGVATSSESLQAALLERMGHPKRVTEPQPIICLNVDQVAIREYFTSGEAVRIQPDDWPPYAEQAWTSIALAKEFPQLRALVVTLDKERIDA